jgi:lysophospholipase L1-like esterase
MSKKQFIYLALGILILICFWFLFFNGDKKQIKNFPSKGTDIVAFGDSLIVGLGATEGNDFVSILSKKIGLNIINLGVSGNTTEDGLNRINELDQYDPKVVLLLLGGNDAIKQ